VGFTIWRLLRITFEQQAARHRTLKSTAVPSTPTLRFDSESAYEPRRYPLASPIDRFCDHRGNDTDLRRCRGTTCGSTMRGARKRGAPPSSFCIVEHSRVASHVQEGIEAGETASPLTNWPSPRRTQQPAKDAAASKSRSAFYRFEIRSHEGGLSPPAISCDESREPSC